MNKGSILKITSTRGNSLGTGFVIDSYDKGIIVATCSHVVSSCNSDSLLVEGYTAIVKNDYKDLGLDLAILIVDGLKREVLTVELSSPKKVKVVGYTQFNTKIRANIKIETMKNIDAEYDIILFGEGEEINNIRLSSQRKISSGYSGSPVICEETGVVIGMVALEVSGNSNDSYTNYAISSKHILEKYDFSKVSKNKKNIIKTSILENDKSFDSEPIKPKVFISYSWDDNNSDDIKKLADNFRKYGVDCFLDRYTPKNIWNTWMQNGIHEADYIFIVCGKTYKEKFDINSKFKDSGVFQEAEYIRDRLNLTGNDISSIFILSFGNINKEHIPKELSRCDKTDCYVDMQLNQLYQHITNQVEAKPKLGSLVKNIPSDIFNNKKRHNNIEPEIALDNNNKKNQNEIIETIRLENGIELVEVKLENKIIYIGKYPVTFEEYDFFCDKKSKTKPYDRSWGRGKRPVIYVSLKDVEKYCKWLGQDSSIMKFQLLSSTDWLKIAELNSLNKYTEEAIWYNKNETIEVDKTKIGSLGIYDMYGNVEEWCSNKVSIGGSYRNKSSSRFDEMIERNKTDKFDFLGFRVIAIKKKEDN